MPKKSEATDAKEPTKTLVDRIKELKRGTKEAQAYAEIGDGMDRAKFRDAWFEVHPPRKGDVVPVDPKVTEKSEQGKT